MLTQTSHCGSSAQGCGPGGCQCWAAATGGVPTRPEQGCEEHGGQRRPRLPPAAAVVALAAARAHATDHSAAAPATVPVPFHGPRQQRACGSQTSNFVPPLNARCRWLSMGTAPLNTAEYRCK